MKLVVVDGYSLAFRAFFAIPVDTMVTSNGQHTNALYGFLSMIDGLLEGQRPTHMVVALDRQEPTFRDVLNPDYKAHRPETHPGLVSQLELLERAIGALGIKVVAVPGFEADDILATFAEIGKTNSIETVLVTGDRDSFQLVADPYVKVLYNRRGVSDYLMLDEAGVVEKVEATPEVYAFLAALRGDPSDNLFGVPGVGPKTAARLANDYRNPKRLFENLDALSPKLAQSIRDNVERIELNYKLAQLVKDVSFDLSLDDLVLEPLQLSRAKEFFDFLESKRLYQRTIEAFSYLGNAFVGDDSEHAGVEGSDHKNQIIFESRSSLDSLLAETDLGALSLDFDYQGEPGRSPVSRILFARVVDNGFGHIFRLDIENEPLQLGRLLAQLEKTPLVGFGFKEFIRRCLSLGLKPALSFIDLGLEGYLADSTLGAYDANSVSERFLPLWSRSTLDESNSKLPDLFSSSGHRAIGVMENVAKGNLALAQALEIEVDDSKLRWLLETIELPLVTVLAKMEAYGIQVDRDYLVALKNQYMIQARTLADQIQAAAGRSFNVNSPKQLGEILFVELKLAPPKKTKTGFSTDAQSLEKLKDSHPIIPLILQYREVEKLRSTYGETLIAEIGDDQKIHASFSQVVARTGRLSSDHPNLHNIPIRTEEGKKFRHAFIAPVGHKLIVADYSQIELRVIAHLSQDPGLVKAFKDGDDIHTQTAAAVFGVDASQVTSIQRAKAKMVAYGLAYGMEAYGLAMRLNVEVPEADAILRGFFAAFPSVRGYMDRVILDARRLGYTETEFGRRRKIPDISDTNFRIRQGAERQAMNAGIQGLAADIFKLALVRLDDVLDSRCARIVLQVHDEVIVECVQEKAQVTSELVKSTLEGVASLRVPLVVNSYIVNSWGDAK